MPTYYVEQQTGSRVDSADEIRRAMRAGDRAQALEALSRSALPVSETPAIISDTWLTHAAGHAIKTYIDDRAIRLVGACSSEQHCLHRLARTCERVYGGVWRVVYDY